MFEVPTNYSCKGKFQKCAWSKISASKIFSTPILISFAYKYSANGFKVIVNYAIQIAGGWYNPERDKASTFPDDYFRAESSQYLGF